MQSTQANTNTSATPKELDEAYYLKVFKRYPLVLSHGEGAKVWDTSGKEYIDALAGIAVNGVGHCHPKVVEAVQQQAGKLMHISNLFISEPQMKLAQKLVEISGLDRVFFTNSGAESNELAIKLARKYGHTKGRGGEIITMDGCFHGRTLATIAAGRPKYQKGFEPIPSGFKLIDFNDINAVKEAITEQTAAIMVEPIQGEGGIHPADAAFLKELRALCDEHSIALVFDEIQTGMGRTGEFFAFQGYGVMPDIMSLAKSLGGGFPIGALLAREHVAEALDFGDHGTTFGGNPLGCAAALATIEAIEEEGLRQKASENGTAIMERLRKEAKSEEAIKDVRGKGLMIGIELSIASRPVVMKMMEKGVIANAIGENIVRFVPPLVINMDELNTTVDVLLESIKESK
ncbi:aspartate aminotransferase family protein [Porifericola rhodea]|uniref:aspartate aminotransferase family protein n=1 Tax=Porifericola rhodea TaxID=930972 RepID=UPI002667136D|nr:aspartate aminotransferase family protein [Porifericola rhodea]WKN31754.1 aspartate aminotransferase family protein [Porifericola rhodea]